MKKIIVADGGAFTRDILRIKLQALGYSVFLAEDGRRLVDLAADVHPDLIVMDILLPTETEGFQACQRIKAADPTRTIPILLLTSRANDPQVIFQYNVWARERIPKPFSPKHVIETVTRYSPP